MDKNKKEFLKLVRLKEQIEDTLSGDLSEEKTAFYNALKMVIDIKVSEEEIYFKFDELQEIFTAIALGDFEHKIQITNRKNLFSFLASTINAVIEELDANVKKNEFLEAALDFIPDPAIVTDQRGAIQFCNEKALQALNATREKLTDLFVANIFESHTQWGILGNERNFTDAPAGLRVYDKGMLPVLLSVKEITDKTGKTAGYIYVAKPAASN